MLNRREFLKAAITALTLSRLLHWPQIASAALRKKTYSGINLQGWLVALGDAVCAASGEPPPALSDIKTAHLSGYSELRANIKPRRIMAHNITFKRFANKPNVLQYIHKTKIEFRLTSLPSTTATTGNGETCEGGVFVWDGANTRLDYGAAWQWIINPWALNFGHIQTWNGSGWTDTGITLTPDLAWHKVNLVVDYPHQTAALTIDGVAYPAEFTSTPKDASWGNTVDARFQAEIVSLYICASNDPGVKHKVRFRNWSWVWLP